LAIRALVALVALAAPPLALVLAAALVALVAGAAPDLASAQEWPVDLELVLAVDASSSVSDEEFDLQVRGLAEAFRSPRVIEAIRASGDLGLAAALIQWSGQLNHTLAVGWTAIHDEKTAADFAEEVGNMSRFWAGNTAIGSALEFALPQFAANGFRGRRKVIDVSGDGGSNEGPEPWLVRDVVVAQGITINGLAILSEDPTVDRYYFTNVIGGTGAFVVTANDYEAFRVAIVAKLIKEISGAPLARRPAPPGTGGPGTAGSGDAFQAASGERYAVQAARQLAQAHLLAEGLATPSRAPTAPPSRTPGTGCSKQIYNHSNIMVTF
jgi:hypothetical protein